jgi:ABC-type antimicrobial peptide transport system permease subunit
MNTLKYAIRFLMRSKSYTLINLFGLAFSLACCIILMRYIHREMTVDTHCIDRENIVVALRDIEGNKFLTNLQEMDSVYIKPEQIMERCQLIIEAKANILHENQSYSMNLGATEGKFFEFFNYPVIEGEATLSAPQDAIITRQYAQRIFGNESPIGKVLSYGGKDITIKGMIDQPACKTTLQMDLFISIHLHNLGAWGRLVSEMLYLLPDVDLEAINKVSNVYRENKGQGRHRWQFISWKDYYFENSCLNSSTQYTSKFGNRTYLRILSAVVVLLLFVGILNFINLYMIFMMKRSKEYGIKKVFGLQRFPLFLQIWMENFLIAIVALLLAWLMVEITQIPVSRLMETSTRYSAFDWQLSLGFLVLLPLLTSIYPYIRYNYLSPMVSIRQITTNRHSIVTRMSFLFIQYIITSVLVIVSIYFNKHLQFLLDTPPGFQTERILEANLYHENTSGGFTEETWKARQSRIAQLEQLMNECPYIETWEVSTQSITDPVQAGQLYNDKDESITSSFVYSSTSFFEIFDLKTLEGKIDKTLVKLGTPYIVLNESAMKALGYKSMEEAFVRSDHTLMAMRTEEGFKEFGKQLMPVSAVIKDFYPGHLTQGIPPMFFWVNPPAGGYGNFYIKVTQGKEKEMIEYLRQAVMQVYNTDDFSYTWMEDKIASIYSEDRKIATTYSVFALIAIIVSCLGLFGISLFDIRQRYREIAIRKVNGAGMKDLYHLLFKKYLTVLGASFVVSVPLAYYLIHQYTADFVVKAPIGIGIFVISLALVAIISMGTLYWQIHKAANIDPAKIMKTE